MSNDIIVFTLHQFSLRNMQLKLGQLISQLFSTPNRIIGICAFRIILHELGKDSIGIPEFVGITRINGH